MKCFEILIRKTKKNPLHTKDILKMYAISLGVQYYGQSKEDLIREMTPLILQERTSRYPKQMLVFYESRLLHVSCYDVRKETVEAHCDYYDIETEGLPLTLMWHALRKHLEAQRRL
jgi:hypothetical protein